MSENSLLESVYNTILRRDLLPQSATLVVGVSGGTDLMALLHLLTVLRDRLAVQLHIATLDHRLRGDQGADDARFVAEIAQAWGLSVTVGHANVRALAQERHIGIEAAARIARHKFLAGVAYDFRATHIAVAHHADDQVETVLLHLLRGSGLAGLSGMAYTAPLPGHPDLVLIRPLLDIPRADLDTYCREHDLHPRHDATNDDLTYTRNRLRRETLPYLRQISPQVERHLLQLAEIAGMEDDFADAALHQTIDPYITRSENQTSLPRVRFKQMHPALQRRFIVWAARCFDQADDMGYVHIAAAVDLALHSEVGSRSLLTGGIQLRLDYDTLVVERIDAPISADLPLLSADTAIPVAIPGVTLLDSNWSLTSSLTSFEDADGQLSISEERKISLRNRRAGDRFVPLGLAGHTQKLSKWMIDHKVPLRLRDQLPLLVIDEEIAAICWQGWVVSENFAVTPLSHRVIFFKLNKPIRLE